MHEFPMQHRGRGAQSNRTGRFEPLQRLDIDDGWSDIVPLERGDGAGYGYGESNTSLKTQWREDRAKTVITKNDSPDLHFDQSVNPYRGCEHGCVYCFARPSHTYLGHSAGLDFERLLYAKLDAAELLRKELGNKNYRCDPIAIGVNTDAYQPLEKRLKITRSILEVLNEVNHPAYLITKSSLIERDIDILSKMAERNLVTVSVSVTSMNNELSHRLEPRAAAPHRRIRIIKTLTDAAIPVRASVSPIIPALNEHEIDEIIKASAEAGARGANAIILRLPHELSQLFPEWLESHYPLRKDRVLKAIKSMRQGKLNKSEFKTRFVGEGPRADIIQQRFKKACKRYGIECGREVFSMDTSLFKAPDIPLNSKSKGVPKAQLSLFS